MIAATWLTCAALTAFSPSDAVYVWQRQWTPLVTQAINNVSSDVGEFVVLGGSAVRATSGAKIKPVDIWWHAFQGSTSAVTVAWRVESDVAPMIRVPTSALAVARVIAQEMQTAQSNACAAGVRIAGLQIDYDCSSSRLAEYSSFMRDLRSLLPNVNLSITALPTWLDKKAFGELAAVVDYYVLQLHSFELPKTADDALAIFPSRRARGYVARARAIGRPFKISLPTYGYEVRFDEKGAFAGIRAEASVSSAANRGQCRVVMTDPAEILGFLQSMHAGSSASEPGVLWFRLPLATDEFNWHVRTLRKVVRREAPVMQIAAHAVMVTTDLYHVEIANTGDTDIRVPVHVPVMVDNGMAFLHDVAGASTSSRLTGTNGVVITATAPRPGSTVVAAWLRLMPDGGVHTGVLVRTSPVTLTKQQ